MTLLISLAIITSVLVGLGVGLFYGIKGLIEFIFGKSDSNNGSVTITEITDAEQSNNPIKSDTQSIILKDAKFDTSRIKEYMGEEQQAFEFRPRNFTQFIGQDEAKKRAETIIKKAKKGMKAHFLVDGIKGHGKTTFCEIIARSLNAHLIERVGKQIDEENLVDIINEINESQSKYVILFIDEIETMDWKVVKVLNPIVESFKINGKKIKPFILCGATINKHILVKNNPDTLDRIPTHIKFARYNNEHIAQILTQYKNQLYIDERVSRTVVDIIAKNCKYNPRTSIALLEEYIVEQDIQRVLQNCGIIKNGLTKTDIKVLTVLSKAKRATGANALSRKVGMSEKEYLIEIEPYLVEFGYIDRTPSRVITDLGRKILKEVNV